MHRIVGCVLAAVVATSASEPEVGQWVEFKGSTVVGPQTIAMSQRFSIVGAEEGADGVALLWFETDVSMSGNRIISKLLLPATAIGTPTATSGEAFEVARRCVFKVGSQPAMELPPEAARQSLGGTMGAMQDSNEVVEVVGVARLETAKGSLSCTIKQYDGRVSMDRSQGPMTMQIQATYRRKTWHSDAVPLVGFVRMVQEGDMTISTGAPGQMPQSQKTSTEMDLVDWGSGATSAITEEPVKQSQF